MLVLIGFIALHLSATGRTETRIAGNLKANAVAAAAADGAIFRAIFNLSDPQQDRRWALDGSDHVLQVGGLRTTVSLEDESARINPDTAPPALVEGLLRATGSDGGTAARLAAAIADWVGNTPVAPQAGELQEQYRAAGLDYTPPGSPLESIDELGHVLGMTPEILAAIRPHLTLFGPASPTPDRADPMVIAAIAFASRSQALSAPNAAPALPPNGDVIARITAIATSAAKARVVRVAVVRAGAPQPMLPRGYAVLAWTSGWQDSD